MQARLSPFSLTLVIGVYECPQALDAVLARVMRGTSLPEAILIADDGSGAGTSGVADAWRARAPMPVRHIWQEHEGFRHARILNKAIAASSEDYLVFLDGDMLPETHFIADHRRLAERGCFVQGHRSNIPQKLVRRCLEKESTLTFARLLGRVRPLGDSIRWPRPGLRYRENCLHALGGNLGVWREDADVVNGFDETFTGWGGEDEEFVARLCHAGRRAKHVHGWAIAWHLDHPQVSQANYADNRERLEESLASGRIACPVGLAQHRENTLAEAS